jgi:metal-responsive CopG/Arc/MetJ family transcriptional regulator
MKMKNITIAVSNIFVDNLEYLQEHGIIPSRSEGIRLAIKEFLQKQPKELLLLGFEVQYQ